MVTFNDNICLLVMVIFECCSIRYATRVCWPRQWLHNTSYVCYTSYFDTHSRWLYRCYQHLTWHKICLCVLIVWLSDGTLVFVVHVDLQLHLSGVSSFGTQTRAYSSLVCLCILLFTCIQLVCLWCVYVRSLVGVRHFFLHMLCVLMVILICPILV